MNEAGRLRMNMMRMVLAKQQEPPEELQRRVLRFNDSLELLRVGDPSRPLFVPWSDEARVHYERVRAGWERIRTDWKHSPDLAASETLFAVAYALFYERTVPSVGVATGAVLIMGGIMLTSAIPFMVGRLRSRRAVPTDD